MGCVGAAHLSRRSQLVQQRQQVVPPESIVVIGRENRDVDATCALLRLMYGFEIDTPCARTIGQAIDAVATSAPGTIAIVFAPLVDGVAAEDTVAMLHVSAPRLDMIVVLEDCQNEIRSDARREMILAAGAGAAVDRDALDSTSLTTAILSCCSMRATEHSAGAQTPRFLPLAQRTTAVAPTSSSRSQTGNRTGSGNLQRGVARAAGVVAAE